MTPLAGPPAGKFLPDTLQNPGFIQTPGRGHQLSGMGVAGQAVDHQVGGSRSMKSTTPLTYWSSLRQTYSPASWSRASPESLMT